MEVENKTPKIVLAEADGGITEGAVTTVECCDWEEKLEKLKTNIIDHLKQGEKCYRDIGHDLLKAKELVGKHGEWLEWLKANVDMSICKAQRLMKASRWMDENAAPVPHLTFTQAYILCRLSKEQLEDFGNFINGIEKVEGMSKRELETQVRDFLKSKNSKLAAVQVSQQEEVRTSIKDDIVNRLGQIKSEVSELASLVDGDSDEYDVFTVELCELCQTIIQKLSPEDVENV